LVADDLQATANSKGETFAEISAGTAS
jgi:hypothetical protein